MGRRMLTPEGVILRAAEIADAGGFESVTLSTVARSLEVQTPSLYGHVRDLSALCDGVTVLALNELSERIEAAIGGRSGRDALYAFAHAHRAYIQEHPGRWESLQRRAGEAAVRDPAAARVVRNTEAILYGYDIASSDKVHATRVIGSALSGFLNMERNSNFDHSEPQTEQSWAVLLEFLHFVLSRWSERDSTKKDSS